MSLLSKPFRWIASQLFGSKVKPYFDANIAPVIDAVLGAPAQNLENQVKSAIDSKLGPVLGPVVTAVIPPVTAQSVPANVEAAINYVLALPIVLKYIDLAVTEAQVPAILEPVVRQAVIGLIHQAVEEAYAAIAAKIH